MGGIGDNAIEERRSMRRWPEDRSSQDTGQWQWGCPQQVVLRCTIKVKYSCDAVYVAGFPIQL